jgi:hypothetical protein
LLLSLTAISPCLASEIDDVGGVVEAVTACWRPPAGLARLERIEQTVRFSLRRDGTMFGEPRVTFVTATPDTRVRLLLTRAAVDAVRNCTPLRLTTSLGGAIAGRPIAVRFIYNGPRGQGA